MGNLQSSTARQTRPPQRMPDPMRMLQTDFDRTFNQFSRLLNLLDVMPGPSLTSALSETTPRIDIRDLPDALEVIAELPGVDESDVDIGIGDGALTIRAQTSEERDVEESVYRVRERSVGRIERVIPLQTAGLDPDKATASFRDGLLTIRIPKTGSSGSGARRIKVESR